MNLRPVYITAILVSLVLVVVNCGRDTVPPADPASSADIPPLVFFNDTGGIESIMLRGTASDNTKVAEVSVAINGTTFSTATMEPPEGAQTVKWIYLATAADLPSGANTILVRAVDSSDNETVSSPIIVQSTMGSTVDSLLAVLEVPRLADTIGLSTGSGFAYGTSTTSWTIPVDADLKLSGAGSATVLEADISHAVLFSVSAGLDLKSMVVRGAWVGIEISAPSADPEVLIEDCTFDGQGAWALEAVDGDNGTYVQFLSSTVDASSAVNASRGGLYLEGVTYFVADSVFTGHTDPGGPQNGSDTGAAIQVVGGVGQITESLFDANALAIWASGGSPLIDSCSISGAAFTTYGINLTGGPATPILQYNHISGNSGYGTRIGGSMMAKVRENVISNNRWAGIYIDFSGTASQVNKINLGKGLAQYGVSDPGNNDFFGNGNNNPDPEGSNEVQVYISSNTAVQNIPAELNYWGVDTPVDVNKVIRDGNDFGLDRGYLDPSPFFSDPQH